MKEHGSKPVGRHKAKSTVEVPSVRHKEKVVEDATTSVSNAKNFESVKRLQNGLSEVPGMHEDFKTPAHRLENISRQVLPDREVARTCVQDQSVSRSAGLEKTVSRPFDFEKSVNKPKVDVVRRFEDKFPRRQQVFHDNSSRSENKLPQKTNRKEECVVNRTYTVEKPITGASDSQEIPTTRLSTHDKSTRQDSSQRRSCQEKVVKKEPRPGMTRHLSHPQDKPEEVLDQCQRRHSNTQQKTKEVCDFGQVQLKNIRHEAHPRRTKGNKQVKTLETHPHQTPPSLFREKPVERSEQGQAPPKNGLAPQQEAQERYAKLPVHFQRPKKSQDRTMGIRDKLSPLQTVLSQSRLEGESDVQERAPLEFQRSRYQSRGIQDPREGESAQSQRHQPYTSETHNSHEQAQSQMQHLPERLLSVHEHETKLIQRQQYLQEKVKSRKMLLGSVISSDMVFSSEACRNWQSATMLSYRYREERSYKHMVLSGDSGVSMGEGSSASRRNSETETDDQTKDDVPTIIAEIGEIVNRRVPSKCLKCQRSRCEMKDASSQHSHPSSVTESPPSSPLTESISSAKIESTALNVMSPPPTNRIYQCRVIRDKNTYGTMFYPVYRMYLERDGRPELLLLTARKRKKCSTSKYLICAGNNELRRKSSSLVGKLRSNLVGTRFHLATYVKGYELEDNDSRPESPFKMESLLLFYETNFLGTKGPRRMKIFLPEAGRVDEHLNLLERVSEGSMEGVLSLVNKEPEWDRETLSHILYFEGRVTKSSVKNFQLVEPPDESSVLLQFGKIGRNEFTLDYHSPINAVQAFAIALSSFDGKIACE